MSRPGRSARMVCSAMVLFLCGGSDQLWTSCTYSHAIQQRLNDRHSTFPRLALSYPDAGHAIDFPMPYEPLGPPPAKAEPAYGSTPTANDQARVDAWRKILAFVRQPAWPKAPVPPGYVG